MDSNICCWQFLEDKIKKDQLHPTYVTNKAQVQGFKKCKMYIIKHNRILIQGSLLVMYKATVYISTFCIYEYIFSRRINRWK